jgi:C1A family cysteine protease
MNIFNGKSLFDGYTPILTEQLLTENNQADVTKDSIKQKFEELGIFEAEQLVAITNTQNKKSTLANALGLKEAFIESLINRSKDALGAKVSFYINESHHRTLGLKLEDNIGLIMEQFGEQDFKSIATDNAELDKRSNKVATFLNNYVPASTNLSFLSFIPIVKDQQEHPTCAAFAATASNEFRLTYLIHNSFIGYIYLSESSIFCEAKKTDRIPPEQGTKLSEIANIIGRIGQAKTRLYPYEGHSENLCYNHNYRQTINSSDLANQKAGIISLNPRSVKALKSAMENQHLPYVGVQLFESIWNARTNENGFINMPISNEPCIGGHAICLVGYFDDPNLPGGGAFIFKNSWGLSWAFNNILNRPGFGLISYKYIETYCSQAFLTI